MLTKEDLQAIRGIIKDEVPQIVKEQVGPIVKNEVNLQLKKELKPIHQKLNKLDKKIDLIARVLDNDL